MQLSKSILSIDTRVDQWEYGIQEQLSFENNFDVLKSQRRIYSLDSTYMQIRPEKKSWTFKV